MKLMFLLGVLLCGLVVRAQTYTIEITVANQPANHLILGLVKGDKFTPTDSVVCDKISKKAVFKIVSAQAPLMYRIVFGQTLMAKVMNEPPQQLDFIFNNENIVFETDFNAVEDNLKVIQSAENKPWFAFRKELKMYGQWMMQLRPYLNSGSLAKSTEAADKRNEYNRALMEREAFIQKMAAQTQNLFVSKLIKMYREPLLDAFLSEQEWFDSYKKEFFKIVDFSNPELVNTSVYTDKAIQFIQSYARKGLTPDQQENEFIKAVEVLMNHVKPYPATSDLLLDYLMRGFEQLGLQKTLGYLAQNYTMSACNPDEKTTLERRLGFQNMKAGSLVPDFTLANNKGTPITFSKVIKEKTLLIFWASWCPHCASVIAELKKSILPTNTAIVAVSIDTSATDWQAKIAEAAVGNWINLSDLKGWDGEVAKKFNVYATPTMFIIDKGLKIISKPMTIGEVERDLK